MRTFTANEQKLLHRIQLDVPISASPFGDIASELGMGEKEIIAALAAFKAEGLLRSIAGIFNASSLGYRSSLVAFELDGGGIDGRAAIVTGHPGVSHNYLRDHRYNLWFTLSVPGEDSLEETASLLAHLAGARDHLLLRTRKLLKIGAMFDVGNGEGDAAPEIPGSLHQAAPRPLSPEERETIRVLQRDLPLTGRPFRDILVEENSFLDERALYDTAARLAREGILRRYAGVLRHRKAGYGVNAMTAWKPGPDISDERIDEVFTPVKAISHLYLRDTYPGRWEYPLFAMIHAKSADELGTVLSRLEAESGIRDYLVLRSLKEFKKERVHYFSRKFEEWKKSHD